MVTFVKRALSVRTVVITLIACAALVSGAIIVPASATAQSSGDGLTNIRVGRHATYDRVVLDFRGPLPGSFRANWVSSLIADPSGRQVPLRGNKFVSVVMQNASSFDVAGRSTYPGPRKFTTPQLRNVEAVTITGDFERVLSIGIGTRHRTWVHVFTLTAPNRLVIDIGR